jgi:hypothetical protein
MCKAVSARLAWTALACTAVAAALGVISVLGGGSVGPRGVLAAQVTAPPDAPPAIGAPPLAPRSAPTTPEAWRATTLADLLAVRDQLQANTPIPYDTENGSYKTWLEKGYPQAVAMAETVQDAAGYAFVMAFFANGFGDPHIAVTPRWRPALRWPGFLAVADGAGGARVADRDAADESAPRLGARILTCDGVSLTTLARQRVFPYFSIPALARDQARVITWALVDFSNPFALPPTHCEVQDLDGARRTVVLRYRIDSSGPGVRARVQTLIGGGDAAWGVSSPASGVTWVGVPSFQNSTRLNALVRTINQQKAGFAGQKALVIDVRGNTGGSTYWADRIARALFPPSALFFAGLGRPPMQIEMRVSEDNLAYWQDRLDKLRAESDPGAPELALSVVTVNALSVRLARGEPIWRPSLARGQTPPSGGLTERRPRSGAPAYPGQVFVLTNGSCMSACLFFLDDVLMIPGVKLIGGDTGADGPYIEVRNVTLPSNQATLLLPQKVMRGMPRGPMEAYKADIAFNGPWTDDVLRAWVLGLIASQGNEQ